jgi:hypothetical protein
VSLSESELTVEISLDALYGVIDIPDKLYKWQGHPARDTVVQDLRLHLQKLCDKGLVKMKDLPLLRERESQDDKDASVSTG